MAVHNAWRYVGDRDALAALLPVAEGVLRWFLPVSRTGWTAARRDRLGDHRLECRQRGRDERRAQRALGSGVA